MSLDVNLEVQEKTIKSKKVGSVLILCYKKPLLDLGKYAYRLKIGFWSTPKGFKIGFGSPSKGLRGSIWFNKG